ncbi:class I SAM-dependent methyltransferase [Ferrovum myxofaciens]|uniref:class I SAM-dependent methyltransferase n=1 Tax=Ferrovum myxofaciens TaxID=416213 RepID=UPI003B5A7480
MVAKLGLRKVTGFPPFLFTRELLANPSAMGAICSSSRRLARNMAAFVPLHEQGLVVELGGGTGTVTAALLERGVDCRRLVTVERSSQLAGHLRRRFPQIRVFHSDAAHLKDQIGGTPVSAVVSSLPLRSLPAVTVQAIVRQLNHVLPPGGTYIQFTYDLRSSPVRMPHRFKRVCSRVTWGNLPPARIDVFRA